MRRAQRADPSSPAVLLALGVSHTNELDSGEALSHLSRWLAAHATHGAAHASVGPLLDSSQAHSHTLRAFEAAAAASPQARSARCPDRARSSPAVARWRSP
jgi:peroxin-5